MSDHSFKKWENLETATKIVPRADEMWDETIIPFRPVHIALCGKAAVLSLPSTMTIMTRILGSLWVISEYHPRVLHVPEK
jgi:hypothetical protein